MILSVGGLVAFVPGLKATEVLLIQPEQEMDAFHQISQQFI